MDIVFIVKSLVGLIALLGFLVVLLVYSPNKKKKENKDPVADTEPKKKVEYSFEELMAIIKKRSSTTEELQFAIENIVKSYGSIAPKMGIRVHDEFYIYSELIIRVCHHPNITKEQVLYLDRELRAKNPKYEQELNDSLTKGLNSRGAGVLSLVKS